ncbi:sensor histidine kinase [Paenibacillus cymbidii]|uniref:sensor histidine kinase n=1 Tax=Paenibacillus cymbidii TaxID=1639034 RepID=UPI0010814AA7|nr:sensor histidine kinase [Paenibacillus cymbidii]
MSLRFKLMVIVIVFLCLPFFIVLYLWKQSTSRTIEQTATDYGKLLVKQTSDVIDAYFRELERDTTPLLLLPSIQQFMQLEYNNGFEYVNLFNKIDKDLSLSSLFRRADYIGMSLRADRGASLYSAMTEEEYRKALQLRVEDRTYGVGGVVMPKGKPLLAYYRYYSNYVHDNGNSLIAIYLDLSRIDLIGANALLPESGILGIIDQNGNYVYHPDSGLRGSQADVSLRKPLPDGRDETIALEKDSQNILIRQRSAYSNWLIVYEVPIQSLSGRLLQMQHLTLLVIAGMAAIVLFLLGGHALLLTRRIILLQKLMRKAEEGDLHVEAPSGSKDELGRLYAGFNRMMVEIRGLLQQLKVSHAKENELQVRQRETAIQAMQSQINPHFLNNTLEAINAYAVREGLKPISIMAVSLARMFRYSVNNQPIVSLAEEIEHIRWYCNILQERSDTLQVDFDVDEEAIAQVACVRLTLQPLVENAFLYGSENADGAVIIAIKGARVEGGYEVRIKDNGKGMEPEKIRQYNERFETASLHTKQERKMARGIGIWNVHRRLRFTFAEPYGLRIVEPEAGGFEICATFPCGMKARS